MCLSCNDVRALDKSISCFMCLKQFHAIFRGDGGSCNNINCNKTFLDQFNKRIEKNSLYEGNFLFVCSPCKTNHEHKDAASLKSHVHCLERKVDSMESSLTEIKSLLRQPATDNTSPIHRPQTQNPTPPINIWNDSTRTSKMCKNLEIAVKSTNNQAPLVDIEKLVVDNGIRINPNCLCPS